MYSYCIISADPEGSAQTLTSAKENLELTKDIVIDGAPTYISTETKEQLVDKATNTLGALTGTSSVLSAYYIIFRDIHGHII